MTELLSGVEAPSDAELISAVRGGDLDAYGDLFERHVHAARRLARQLMRGPDSDDLVSEAFTKVMTVLQSGGGPDVAFRAYLLTAVRRLHVDRMRAQAKVTTSDDMTRFDPGVPFHDTAVAGFESGAAAKAFATLPERWQLVLWHLEVEGQKPAEIAPLLGMSANSVSALAYRAREGLRQAFLTAHLADTSDADCRWVNEHLGGYVRSGLSKRDSAKVKAHLDECRQCSAMYLELTEVNSNLSAIIAPLLLGAAASGYLASAGGGAAAGGVLLLLDRAKDAVLGNLGTVAAGTAAAGIVAAAVVAVAMSGGGEPPTAQPPNPRVSLPVPSNSDRPSSTQAPKPQVPPTAVVPPVAEVVDPEPSAAEPAPKPSARTANIALASATVSDDAVVLDIEGLPAGRTVVGVDLRSASGQTTFKPQNSQCSVKASNRRHASCVTSAGGGGNAVLLLAPTRFRAVIPLAFPAGLKIDRLSVTISLAGYRDPAQGNNSARLTFRPDQPEPPAAPPSADLRLALDKVDDRHVAASVTGVPAEGATLVFHVSGAGIADAPRGCSLSDSDTVRCPGARGPFTRRFGLTYDASQAPVKVTMSVSAQGVRETKPADNTRTVTVGAKPAPTADLALAITGKALGNGTGRFRANVTGIPDQDDATVIQFEIAISRPDVDLEDIPKSCSYVKADHSVVECSADDATFSGVFDANLRRLRDRETVKITLTVGAPGYDDPNLSNNTKVVEIGRRGIVGVTQVVLGEEAVLAQVGAKLDDLTSLIS